MTTVGLIDMKRLLLILAVLFPCLLQGQPRYPNYFSTNDSPFSVVPGVSMYVPTVYATNLVTTNMTVTDYMFIGTAQINYLQMLGAINQQGLVYTNYFQAQTNYFRGGLSASNFFGIGAGLTGIPAAAVTGLNTNLFVRTNEPLAVALTNVENQFFGNFTGGDINATNVTTTTFNSAGMVSYADGSGVFGGGNTTWNGDGDLIISGAFEVSDAIFGTNGLVSFAADTPLSINANGRTNTLGKNATAYVTAVATAFTIKDSGANTLYTSPVLSTTISVTLQPDWSVNSASGLSGSVIPW